MSRLFFLMLFSLLINIGCSAQAPGNYLYLTDLGSSEFEVAEVSDYASIESSWKKNQPSSYVIEYLFCGFGCDSKYRAEIENGKVIKFCQYEDRIGCTELDSNKALTMSSIISAAETSAKESECIHMANKSLGMIFSENCPDLISTDELHAHAESSIFVTLFGSNGENLRSKLSLLPAQCLNGSWKGNLDETPLRLMFTKDKKFQIQDGGKDPKHQLTGMYNIDDSVYPYQIKIMAEDGEIYLGVYKCTDSNTMELIITDREYYPTKLEKDEPRSAEFKRI